ncbi:MAG: hypothetical protein AB9869_05490 [Verrucomicrobiia bacterium]
MKRINLELAGNRLVSFDDDGQNIEQLATFIARHYPGAESLSIQNVPRESFTTNETPLEVPAMNFGSKSSADDSGEEAPLEMPVMNFDQ